MASHIVADKDTANRVSRFVGQKADNTPMRAYLLKCPDEVWADREAGRLEQADAWDASIRQKHERPEHGTYVPKGITNHIDTQFRKEY